MLSLHTGDCSRSQFQSSLTHNEEALGDHFSEMEYKKFTHTHIGTKEKMVCRSSMTSGNSKLIDLAKLVAPFLYLNSFIARQGT